MSTNQIILTSKLPIVCSHHYPSNQSFICLVCIISIVGHLAIMLLTLNKWRLSFSSMLYDANENPFLPRPYRISRFTCMRVCGGVDCKTLKFSLLLHSLFLYFDIILQFVCLSLFSHFLLL